MRGSPPESALLRLVNACRLARRARSPSSFTAAFSLTILEDPLLIGIIAAGVVISVVQASFFEWAFHRFWLHRPWLPENIYTAHTLVHHQLCKYDDTFHVTEEEQEEALTFLWWNGPALVAINLLPWSVVTWVLSSRGVALPYIPFLVSFGVMFTFYYLAYEGFHLLMHKPSYPWIENLGYFKFLKRHHVIHHTRMNKNLNVVFPLADWCLGSLELAPLVEAGRKTPDAARRTARRHSVYGKKLRDSGVDTSAAGSRENPEPTMAREAAAASVPREVESVR